MPPVTVNCSRAATPSMAPVKVEVVPGTTGNQGLTLPAPNAEAAGSGGNG